MRIDVLTLFPEVFANFLDCSILGRARTAGLVEVVCTGIRDFGVGPRRTVDDRPFGGGPGMVLMCEPVFAAFAHAAAGHEAAPVLIMLTPQGERLTQGLVRELSAVPRLMLLCGHYEGFDERIREGLSPREVSIGDYVLSGGEPAAMVLIDAVVRLLPGALGGEGAAEEESFSAGLLEYPQYTRPREFQGRSVPEVLLSGDHQKVAEWRYRQAVERTGRRRPDLLSGAQNPGAGSDKEQ